MTNRTVTIAVVGVSGRENVKGAQGVGKSLLCNRFIRGDYDDFITEHSSVLSQTDFSGSPVINNDHWLYWGDRCIDSEDGGSTINLRVVEQTEFLDDETYEPLAGPSTLESYPKRAARVKLESKDKLMYLQKEQLGLEVEFPQQLLPDGKCQVDGFIFVFDASRVPGRSFESQVTTSLAILGNIVKTKKPLVLAISKCDIWDEEWRKAVQQLVSGKVLKGIQCPMVETSSFMSVNVEEVFSCAAGLALKGKTRTKTLPFGDAARIVADHNCEIRQSFIRLLQGLIPIDSWPVQRLSFQSLRIKLGIDRHKDYIAFIRKMGEKEARKLYDQHVNEAREHWMGARLKALFPKLPHVFAALLDCHDVPQLTWADAKRVIQSHAFFEEYFQPFGVLGRQLDPLSPDTLYEEKRVDPRIPAEILMRGEARDYYESFKASIEAEQRQERLEDDFECLLAETAHVTPGRTLQDVSIFLQGCEPYEALAPNQAAMVYDRFQTDLVQRAEHDFNECLLEHVEVFVEIINNHRFDSLQQRGVYLSDEDLLYLKDVLQEDHRYRQLSRLSELRDNMIHQFDSFVASPSISRCFAKQRCCDVVAPEVSLLYFQRRKLSEITPSVELAVHGDISTVAQFITELNVMLRNGAFHSASGQAFIRCYGADEYSSQEDNLLPRSQLFLIDSAATLERTKSAVIGENIDPPPLFVLVCDPSNYDLLPQLHQQGTALAELTGGVFIGAGTAASEDSHWSKNSDCSSIFGKDQLVRVCEAACTASINPYKCDLRVKVSIMCGDPFPIETFLSALLSPKGAIQPAAKYNDILGGGVIPLSLDLPSGGRCRVDLSISSYHNWTFARNLHGRNGHILLFSAKRPASLAHAKAAIARILDCGSHSVSGKCIFLIAVVDKGDRFDDECSNLLLTEGSELATSIGASFTILHTEEPCHPSCSATFLSYFTRLMYIAPQYPSSSSTGQLKRESDGYATLSEFQHLNLRGPAPPYSKITTDRTAESLSSDSTISTGRLYSGKRSEPSNMKTSMSAGSMTASVSSVHRPRRRVAPTMTPVRIPAFRPPVMAPLATPEAIEIAPDYSLVQDALTDDDHIYATLDFEKEYADHPTSEDSYAGEESPRKEKKRPLGARILNVHSTSAGTNYPAARVVVSSTSSSSSSSEKKKTAPVILSSSTSGETHRTPALLRSSHFRPAGTQTQPISIQKSSASATSAAARSSTAEVVKHRRPLLVQPMERGLRHSLSAESIVDLIRGKKKRAKDYASASKFVRKVATSFRMKKLGEKSEEPEDDNRLLGVAAPSGCRSLPQSPQVERRTKKLVSNGEKPSAFSWLPTRSPRRQTKSLASEKDQGVVSPTDTLDSLCKNGGGLPLFLTRCVEFIEKDGLQLEGLYRVPGNQSQLLEMEKVFREKGDIDLEKLGMPVHVVATAVKNFFSRIPDPIIPTHFHQRIIDRLDDDNVEMELRSIFSEVAKSNLMVLRYFTDHLHRVAASVSTAMDVKNLSKVWFPTFFRPNFTSFEAMSSGTAQYERAMEAILSHSATIFS